MAPPDPDATTHEGDPSRLVPGTILAGAYRVLRPLAEGGMACVYEVEHLVTGAHRALKVMHLQVAGDPHFAQRLLQEARVGTRIRSDHVAEVIDAGVDPELEVPFIVMELLDGVALSEELRRRGRFSVPEVLEILHQLCHALAAAHDDGIVHLDLKPANVFLARSGIAGFSFVVKVLDFGIAQILAEEGADAGALSLGTPAWMAPEQIRGAGSISPRTDVWALGLLSYTLLTGRVYWRKAGTKASSADAVLREILVEPVVPATERAAEQGVAAVFPPGFDNWFLTCADRDPDHRFADARAAYLALRKAVPSPMDESSVRLVPSTSTPTSSVGVDTASFAATTSEATTAVNGPAARRLARRHSRHRATLSLAVLGALLLGALFAATAGRHRLVPSRDTPSATAAGVGPLPSRPEARSRLRLCGSNTAGRVLGPALAEGFLRQRVPDATITRRPILPDEFRVEASSPQELGLVAIEISAHGSSTAFTELGAGRCDIGISSRRIRGSEAKALRSLGDLTSAASEHTVALDGIAIVTNPRNTVEALTREQVAEIFSGTISRWSAVGGPDVPITVVARDEQSGTYDSFRDMVLGPHALTPQARRFADSGELADAVAAESTAIGFVGFAHVRSAKAVMIRDGRGAAQIPAPRSVATEDYPLSRRIYFYVPSAATAVARDFLDYTLSEPGQAIVEQSGFVDLLPECDELASEHLAASAAYLHVVRGACRLSVSLRFDPATDQLDSRGLRDLVRAATAMARPPLANRRVILVGLADSERSATAARRLSERLVAEVAEQLRARGVHASLAVGLGRENRLTAPGTTETLHRSHRVELWLR